MRGLTDKRMEQIRRAGACYAAAYLLMTIAMDYVDAGDDACKAAGLRVRNQEGVLPAGAEAHARQLPAGPLPRRRAGRTGREEP